MGRQMTECVKYIFRKLLFLFILIGEQALVHTFLPSDNRTDNLKCFIPATLSKCFEDVDLLFKRDADIVLRNLIIKAT